MVIESQLSRDQFIRLFLLRHFQRMSFYFYALTSGALTAYALMGGPFVLIFVGWVPLGLYIMAGLISAFMGSWGQDRPYLLRTRYEFGEEGVKLQSAAGNSALQWQHIAGWRVMVGCYVLELTGGAILAIPQKAVPPHRMSDFEALLRRHVGERR